MAALVDPRIKHDRVRRVVEVALTHWFDLGVRGTSAGRGGSGATVLGMVADVVGNLAGSRHAGGVGFGKGVLLTQSAGGLGVGLRFGTEYDVGVGVIDKAGEFVAGSATVRKVAVGFEPAVEVVFEAALLGHPSDLLLLEVVPVVVQGDVEYKLVDLGTSFLHFVGEVVKVAVTRLPALGDGGDEDLVVVVFSVHVGVGTSGDDVDTEVNAGRAVVRDEPEGLGD